MLVSLPRTPSLQLKLTYICYGRCPGEGNGKPLQYSCLENSMDRGAWRGTVHGAPRSRKWLNDSHFAIELAKTFIQVCFVKWYVCMCANSLQSGLTPCNPMDHIAHQSSLSMAFSEHKWSGLPCPPPGDLSDPGIKTMSLTSPALAGRLFFCFCFCFYH